MRKKSNIEKHNDALLFWNTLGPIIYRIVGIIIVGGLLATFFIVRGAINRRNEQVAIAQQQELTAKRQEIVDQYIANNPKTFGTVTKQWNSGSLFFVESDYGEFTIAFEDLTITKVLWKSKAGKVEALYEK